MLNIIHRFRLPLSLLSTLTKHSLHRNNNKYIIKCKTFLSSSSKRYYCSFPQPPDILSLSRQLVFKRILLKLSGEALAGKNGHGVDPQVLKYVASEITKVKQLGAEIAVVVGGGNYFRGANAFKNLDRAQRDNVGMLATCMNALMLQGEFSSKGTKTVVQTAIDMKQIAEPYNRLEAIRHLEEGKIVIFGAGSGSPFFTTDTAAAIRAAELKADILMKATKVDGIYTCDPVKNPDSAVKYESLTYDEISEKQLEVMDATAVILCKEQRVSLMVFDLMREGNVVRAACGERGIGTVVLQERAEQQQRKQ